MPRSCIDRNKAAERLAADISLRSGADYTGVAPCWERTIVRAVDCEQRSIGDQ
ncbi:hypothetical protein [Sphingobium herbicidovorans]|uniref:hypothetical protein n=1 Tax=Sphingobium herbicidovorans TaxID=76947 RepID=UPI000A730F28|nr:hypothetical protein [Sphingobium herbicidovorans]